jgi:Fe-S oxidoreductase
VKVGLFIPCYIDAFFPEVGIATLELLEKLGIEVDYPLNQTCCGQPMANAGSQRDAAGVEALFVKNFSDFEFIVTPSGSCAHHVHEHLDAIPDTPEVQSPTAYLRARRISARRSEGYWISMGGISTQGGAAQYLHHIAEVTHRKGVRN